MDNAACASDWRGTATEKRQATLFAPPLRDNQIRLWKNAVAESKRYCAPVVAVLPVTTRLGVRA